MKRLNRKRSRLWVFGLASLVLCFIFLGSALAGSAQAFFPGETKGFNINSEYDYFGRNSISATLRQAGDKALFYVDDELWNSGGNDQINSAVLKLLSEFDEIIYPRVTKVFGAEWNPGIDNEGRITILLFKMKDIAGGYFNTIDEFPKSVFPLSNEREMVYLNSNFLGTARINNFLAHEFQHLINYYQKEKLRGVVEDIWLNEARSEYAPTLCGYDEALAGSNLEKRSREFIQNSSDSLTEWREKIGDYGTVNLFMQYLMSRYGEVFLKETMRSEKTGIASINDALEKLGFKEKFEDVFMNWLVANYANDCLLGEQKIFCYLNSNLADFKIIPNLTTFLLPVKNKIFSFSDNTKDWSGRWYRISGGGENLDLKLEFKSQTGENFKAAVLVLKSDGKKEIQFFSTDPEGKFWKIFKGFGSEIDSIVLIPFSYGKKENFTANESLKNFSYSMELGETGSLAVAPVLTPSPAVSSVSQKIPSYPDGSLIRAEEDYKVYVIKGNFKRWIQSPQILLSYSHWDWNKIIKVSTADRDWYKDAGLIRAENDYKVYEANGDMSKHWLNISTRQFTDSGRDWNMIFAVNKAELDLYKTGADVMR